MDLFRSKYLQEVACAYDDDDLRRANNRLNLLAASGVNEALTIMGRTRTRARDILQVEM